MDIQKQLALAAVAKAHKRNGTTPPPELMGTAPPKSKAPIKTGADPKQSSKAKSAAAAAIAARLGGGLVKGSPPSAAGSSAGSTVDNATIEKYRKMIKMGVPAGAVRGKMSAEGIPPSVVNEVLSVGSASAGGATSPSHRAAPPLPPPKKVAGGSSTLTPSEERIAAKYRKMIKLGLPDGAVRHKMTSDGVSNKIQDSVLAGEVPGGGGGASSSDGRGPPCPATGGAPVSKLSPKDEKIAAQYRKMSKIGLPSGAIRHKMVSDGVPHHIQDSVLLGESPAAPGQPAPSNGSGASAPSDGAGGTSRLSLKEEKIAAQYRKMVKMGLPDGAVIHKMSMDGVPKNIQDSVLAREVPATQVQNSVPAGSSAAAFAVGAAALRSAPKQSQRPSADNTVGASMQGGSPLAAAAAAAAALRGKRPKKPPRDIPQNPLPTQSENASGPAALAAAAVAAANRRTERRCSNPSLEQFDAKRSPHKVNTSPSHMVALKSSNARPNTPADAPKTNASPDHPKSCGPTPARTPVTATPLRSRAPSPPPAARRGPSIPGTSSSSPARRNSASRAPQTHPGPSPGRTTASPAQAPESAPLSPQAAPPVPRSATTPTPRGARRPPIAPVASMPVESMAPARTIALAPETVGDQRPVTSPATGLSPDEEEVAEHYRGLVRAGKSLDEVRDEMQSDGAPSHIQTSVVATFDPPLSSPSTDVSTTTIAESTHMAQVDDASSTKIMPPPGRLVPESADPKIHPISVVTAPESSVVLLKDDPQFKLPKEEPAALEPPEAKNSKKKRRKKTTKGTTILEDGAEQHCNCNLM